MFKFGILSEKELVRCLLQQEIVHRSERAAFSSLSVAILYKYIWEYIRE